MISNEALARDVSIPFLFNLPINQFNFSVEGFKLTAISLKYIKIRDLASTELHARSDFQDCVILPSKKVFINEHYGRLYKQADK